MTPHSPNQNSNYSPRSSSESPPSLPPKKKVAPKNHQTCTQPTGPPGRLPPATSSATKPLAQPDHTRDASFRNALTRLRQTCQPSQRMLKHIHRHRFDQIRGRSPPQNLLNIHRVILSRNRNHPCTQSFPPNPLQKLKNRLPRHDQIRKQHIIRTLIQPNETSIPIMHHIANMTELPNAFRKTSGNHCIVIRNQNFHRFDLSAHDIPSS